MRDVMQRKHTFNRVRLSHDVHAAVDRFFRHPKTECRLGRNPLGQFEGKGRERLL